MPEVSEDPRARVEPASTKRAWELTTREVVVGLRKYHDHKLEDPISKAIIQDIIKLVEKSGEQNWSRPALSTFIERLFVGIKALNRDHKEGAIDKNFEAISGVLNEDSVGNKLAMPLIVAGLERALPRALTLIFSIQSNDPGETFDNSQSANEHMKRLRTPRRQLLHPRSKTNRVTGGWLDRSHPESHDRGND